MSKAFDFQELVLGRDSSSFRSLFEREWYAHISAFPEDFETASQLKIGSRFRPCLVAWGYLLTGSSFDVEIRSRVAKDAVYVELLHKATLLIDDLIDEDLARHGEPAFHIEFNDHEAILFAIYLLGDCITHLAEVSKSLNVDRQNKVLALLGAAIKSMASGGILESRLSPDELSNVEKMKRIIELQTISLVKNGLLVGYHLGEGAPSYTEKIENLGYDAGYIFQVLNDLEPFYGPDKNEVYKGRENTDFSRLKKNYLVANFLEDQSQSRRQLLISTLSEEPDRARATLLSGFKRSEVLSKVGENLRLVRKNIDRVARDLPIDVPHQDGFLRFVDFVLERALSRLDERPRQILSDILIK